MLDFSTPRKPRTAEAVFPMINVVFLLLIFFLMTARIAPSAPFAVSPPRATAETPAEGANILFISADGALHYRGFEGDEVWANLPADAPLMVRADGEVEGATFARVLTQLRAAGLRDLTLATVPG